MIYLNNCNKEEEIHHNTAWGQSWEWGSHRITTNDIDRLEIMGGSTWVDSNVFLLLNKPLPFHLPKWTNSHWISKKYTKQNKKITTPHLAFLWFKFKYTSKIHPKLHKTSKDGKTRQSCQCLPFSQPLQLTAVLTSDGRRPLQRSSRQLARLNIQWDTWPRQGRQRGCSEHRAIVIFAGREMVDDGYFMIFYEIFGEPEIQKSFVFLLFLSKVS